MKNEDTKFSKLVIKFSGGLIKTPNQANLALVIFVIISLLATFYSFSSSDNSLQGQYDPTYFSGETL